MLNINKIIQIRNQTYNYENHFSKFSMQDSTAVTAELCLSMSERNYVSEKNSNSTTKNSKSYMVEREVLQSQMSQI